MYFKVPSVFPPKHSLWIHPRFSSFPQSLQLTPLRPLSSTVSLHPKPTPNPSTSLPLHHNCLGSNNSHFLSASPPLLTTTNSIGEVDHSLLSPLQQLLCPFTETHPRIETCLTGSLPTSPTPSLALLPLGGHPGRSVPRTCQDHSPLRPSAFAIFSDWNALSPSIQMVDSLSLSSQLKCPSEKKPSWPCYLMLAASLTPKLLLSLTEHLHNLLVS
jgi:hypothetical protein